MGSIAVPKRLRPRVVFDSETYINYTLFCFENIEDGRRRYFEMWPASPGEAMRDLDRQGVAQILRNCTIVGFNSLNFDVPILRLALRQGTSTKMIKTLCDQIIVGGMKPWTIEKQYDLPPVPWIDHIDLIEPAPSVGVGLKLYGGRLHSKRLQDLPIEPGAMITREQRPLLVDYCWNDCAVTKDLYRHIEPQIALRTLMSAQYGVELRSKSDAQIAESVIRHELERIKGEKLVRPELPPDYSFKYVAPEFISFKSERMQDLLRMIQSLTFKLAKKEVKDDSEQVDSVGADGIKLKISGIKMPVEIAGAKSVRDKVTRKIIKPAVPRLKIPIGETVYTMGIGGLHSCESKVANFSDDSRVLVDNDVASYYPAIMINCGLYPDHLGVDFINVYRKIRDERIYAKHQAGELKDKIKALKKLGVSYAEQQLEFEKYDVEASTKKVTCNGTFGKLGSKWSFMFAPNLMLQVTLTGQLSLLMLIEELENAGIPIISANTDGIVSNCPRTHVNKMREIIKRWELKTGFEMEAAEYKALYSRDVNSYLAIKPDGSIKQKGAFAFTGSKGSPAEKNPANYVCIDAVIAYLTKGTPIMDTLEWCSDIRKFITVRRVSGGALYRGEYAGKTVRWYYAKGSTDFITSIETGNKVSRSDGCKLMMELQPGLPDDIDFSWYHNEALSMLGELGVL